MAKESLGAAPTRATDNASKGYVDGAVATVSAIANGAVQFVNFGSTTTTARPSGAPMVIWYGTGTPTHAAAQDMVVQAAGGGGTAPTITTASVSSPTKGTAYSQSLAATGSTPITYAVTSGTLPPGLAISTGGAITGTPTAYGAYSFTVTATNTSGNNAKTYTGTGYNTALQPPSGMTKYNFSTLSASLGNTDVAYVAAHMPGAGALILDIPGTYQWRDFAVAVDAPDCFALGIYSANCKSILGSTPNPSDTILQMVAGSSTFPTADIPPDSSAGATNAIFAVRVPQIGNLTVDLTNQGHFFSGVQINSDDSPSTAAYVVDNLIIRGSAGDSNYPPGETSNFSFLNVHGTSGTNYTVGPNVESTGIRAADSALVGASPWEWNGSSFITHVAPPTGAVDAPNARAGIYCHDTLTSMPTLWTCTDIVINNITSTNCGSSTGVLSGTGVNMERATRITFNNPTLNVSKPTTLQYQHFNVNSDTFNAVVAINNPVFNHPTYDPTHLTFYIGATYASGQQTTGSLVTVNGTAITGSPTPACAIYH